MCSDGNPCIKCLVNTSGLVSLGQTSYVQTIKIDIRQVGKGQITGIRRL